MAAENVKVSYDKNKKQLTLVIDTGKNLGESKSGKNKMVAKTGGFTEVSGTDLRFNLNVIRPNG